MKTFVTLSQKELTEAVAAWVRNQGFTINDDDGPVIRTLVTFETHVGDREGQTETTATVHDVGVKP